MVAFQGYRFGRGAINEVLNNTLPIAGGRLARLVNARLQSIPVFLRFIPVILSPPPHSQFHLHSGATGGASAFTPATQVRS